MFKAILSKNTHFNVSNQFKLVNKYSLLRRFSTQTQSKIDVISSKNKIKDRVKAIPNILEFLDNKKTTPISSASHLGEYGDYGGEVIDGKNKYFIETYGWQMNVADTEIVETILDKAGYHKTQEQQEANLVFVNTCSIREKAESKIWNKISNEYKGIKK